MPSKKQSARPAESGWLLEVGIIGIDKTLKLLKLTGWSLLELEQVLRPWLREGVKYSDKAKLPWLKIPPAPWEVSWKGADKHLLGDWEECLARQTRKLRRKLTESEWESLAEEWFFARGEYPGRDEVDCLFMDLQHFEEVQRRKGRGPTSERPSLTRWMLDAKTLGLFRPGTLDNDTERKKLERIKAHSLALCGALKEIAGKGRAKSKHYPKQIAEIISHSRGLPLKRREFLAREIARAESSLNEHDAKRIRLLSRLELLRDKWKKVGNVSR